MAETLRDLANGTIGRPYRAPHMEALGTVADLLERAGAYLNQVGVTVPKSSPVFPGASLTLRDLTIGELPRVLEDISYGMGPSRGGNYATGGIGTLGQMEPSVLELANLAPAWAGAAKMAQKIPYR